LHGHEVETAEGMGWALLENGDLLRAAEDSGFELMITCDQKISYQQNLKGRRLALVVLNTNNWNVLKKHTEPVVSAINAARPGSFQALAIRKHRHET
jgi:hypothetical protein